MASNLNADAQLTREELVQKVALLSASLARRDQTIARVRQRLEHQDDSSDSDMELPDALHDPHEDVYRCSECDWEVVDGRCQWCRRQHRFVEGMASTTDNLSTENQALRGERQLAPRGLTPLDEIGEPNIHRDYIGRANEYLELLRRGATRTMCETFNLEFKNETGIIAWADCDLFESMSGPAMLQGHLWKIYLGRRIQLNDDDLDGSEFIEDLLEDAVLFPFRSSRSSRVQERWETVEESTGLWATRPMENSYEDTDEDSDEPDCGSSDEESETEWDKYQQEMDDALEPDSVPFAWDHHPAICTEEYEAEVYSDMDVEEYPESDFDPANPDREFIDDDAIVEVAPNVVRNHAPSAAVEAEAQNPVQGGSEAMVSDVTLSDSDTGSDFDADEELSGDEAAEEEVRVWKTQGWPTRSTFNYHTM